MRKPDEVALYAALRARADGRGYWGGRSAVVVEMGRLDMPEKRAFYLLQKWTSRGWVDYGMWAWGGWFTPSAPVDL